MSWWFYDYVLKDEHLVNWPLCFVVHFLIQAKMLWFKMARAITGQLPGHKQ